MLKFLLEVMNGNHVGLRLPALAQIRPSEAADRGKDCLYLDCEVASSPRRYTRCFSQAVWAEQTWSEVTHGHSSWAHMGGRDMEVWTSLESWDIASPHTLLIYSRVFLLCLFLQCQTLKKDTGWSQSWTLSKVVSFINTLITDNPHSK